MTAAALMDSLPALRATDTVESALTLLLQQRLPALAVVDEHGRYLGLLGVCRLLGLLLPRAATLDGTLIQDLAYLSETAADARERFEALRAHPVSEYLDPKAPAVRPQTPLMETLWMLYRSQNVLPVVDEESGRLQGVVSSFAALAALLGER